MSSYRNEPVTQTEVWNNLFNQSKKVLNDASIIWAMTSVKSFGLLNCQLMQSYDHIIFQGPQIRLWQSQHQFVLFLKEVVVNEAFGCWYTIISICHNCYVWCAIIHSYSKLFRFSSDPYPVSLFNAKKKKKKFLGFYLQITKPMTTAWYHRR